MIRAATKRVVRTLYLRRCGYCGVTEWEIGAELTYDHFQPQTHGGSDIAANIVYSCHACNEFKGVYWSEDEATRLLHPLNDDLPQHLIEETSGLLTALTERGKIHRDQLQLNRLPLVQRRLERNQKRQAMAEQERIQRTLKNILQRLQAIEERLR